MHLRLGGALLALAIVVAEPAHGQLPKTAEGAYAFAVQDLLSRGRADRRTQFVTDSASLSRFVSCKASAAGPRCMLTDTVPVMLVRIRMRAADTAEVLTGNYRMYYARCPSRTVIDPPIVGVDHHEMYTLVHRGVLWFVNGKRSGIAC